MPREETDGSVTAGDIPRGSMMRRAFVQFIALAGLTVRESARQPVFLLLAASSTALTALLPMLVTHTLGEGARLIRDSALAIHLVTGLLLGGLLAGASLRREIRTGTAAAVLSKPIAPAVFFLAKFAGLAVVLAAYGACSLLTAATGVRILHDPFHPDYRVAFLMLGAIPFAFGLAALDNFFTCRPFVSRAFWLLLASLAGAWLLAGLFRPPGAEGGAGVPAVLPLLPASLLITMAVWILAALCLSLAAVMDPAPALSIAAALFLLGLVSDYAFGRAADASALAAFLYRVIPNWQHFWGADALAAGGIPWSYAGRAALYASAHLAGWLTFGIVAVRHLEWKS